MTRRTAPEPDDQVVAAIIEKSRHDSERPGIAPLSPDLVDVRTEATLLSVGVTKVEDFVRQGCPFVDVGEHDPRRRPKRCLRFHPPSVLAWLLRERGRNGQGGAGA